MQMKREKINSIIPCIEYKPKECVNATKVIYSEMIAYQSWKEQKLTFYILIPPDCLRVGGQRPVTSDILVVSYISPNNSYNSLGFFEVNNCSKNRWLVRLYSISTLICYAWPNPVYIYIYIYIICKQIVCK